MYRNLATAAVLMATLVLSANVNAQNNRIVIRGGRIFDGTGTTTRPLGQLWLKDGRIVGEVAADAGIPARAHIIDATGCTVLPGLFDLHVHIAVPGGPPGFSGGVLPEENLATQLYCGVTSVLDLHADESTVFELREKSKNSPKLARLYTAGAAFTVPGGHATQFGVQAHEVETTEDVAREFQSLLPKKPDVIKAVLEHGGWGGTPTLPTLSDETFEAIAKKAHAAGLPLFVHAWTIDEAKTAVRFHATALAHGVFMGEVTPAFAAQTKKSGTAYVPTLSVVIAGQRALKGDHPYKHRLVQEALHPDLYEAIDSDTFHAILAYSPMARLRAGGEKTWMANLMTMVDAGVPVGLGTDAGNPLVPHGPAALLELTLYVEAGLSPGQALQAATRSSARILGVEDRYGSLEAGKVADVVIVSGNPSQKINDIWNVRDVIKAGVLVDRDATRRLNAKRNQPAVTLKVGDRVGRTIDSFEDGDLKTEWGGTWTVLTDEVAGGKSTCRLSVGEVETNKTLRIVGSVNKGFTYGPWSGVTVQWDPRKKRLVDATGFTGLQLRLRGTERPYGLTVHRAAVKDFNYFNVSVPVKKEWSVVSIPFASLRQIGFGKPVTWAANDIAGIALDARNPFPGPQQFGTFELEVDWIRLY